MKKLKDRLIVQITSCVFLGPFCRSWNHFKFYLFIYFKGLCSETNTHL